MYYHIFPTESVYSKSLLDLLEKNVDMSENKIIIILSKKNAKKIEYSEAIKNNILYLKKSADLFNFLKNIKQADWIYIHYLAYHPTLLFWAVNKNLLKKTTWIAWGNDIYSYYKQNKNIKTRIYEKLRIRIIKELPEIAVFVKEDFDLITKLYNTKATYTSILYPIPVNIEHLENLTNSTSDTTTRFLIGNSADISNLHHEMIDYLSRFKHEDIQIYCPLSYGGSTDYIKSVIDVGKNTFGEKFIAIQEMMNQAEYANFLNNIDIALMNHKRQQGLGNILALLFLGKKVYLRNDITSFYYFKRQNCEVYDIKDLNTINFETLITTIKDAVKLKQQIAEIISEKNYLHLWLALFNKHKQ